MSSFKLQDTSPIIGNNSRLEQYWLERGFEEFYTHFRKGKRLPGKYQTMSDLQRVTETFHLKAIGFGNWVTQEDRFNYLSALILSLYDIGQVVRFSSNIGLNNTLSISFGARGSGKALAHFEPNTFIINITRYKDGANYSKMQRFVNSGGAGSFAHEYGHALDYYFGKYREPSSSLALSNGRTTASIVPVNLKQPLRAMVNTIINAINSLDGKTKSPYRQRLEKKFSGDYIIRRNEIFARAFEQYVFYRLGTKGISNSFLHDTKYSSDAYMKESEFKAIIPGMDNLITLFNVYL